MIASKKDGLLYKRRFFIIFFLYQLLYHIIIVNRLGSWELNDLTDSLYRVDFSYGFGSKLLPGAVYNLLFGRFASRQTANIYVVILMILFFAGLSLILEKFILRIPAEYRNSALLLLVFFLSGAYTFSIYTKWVGLLDGYWLFISLAFIVCLEHKWLRYLIPFLYILSLLIHFSALVFVLTFFSIMLLYRVSVEEEKKERTAYIIIFTVSLCFTAVAFLFLILNETQMVCPIDEFHEKLLNHGTDYFFYHDYAFFRVWGGESFIPESVNETKPFILKFLYLFYYQIRLNYDLFLQNTKNGIISTVGGAVILSPILYFFFKFHLFSLRQKGNGLRRFCAFLMIVQFPFVFVLGLLFATGVDMTRYITHGFLVSFSCVLLVLNYEKNLQTLFFERMKSFENSLPLKIYFLAYATITLLPC